MKEDIKPKDGKRKLYFTIDMQNFISYNLEPKTTCELLFEANKNLIYTKLSEINNNSKIDLNNYDFFLVDLKALQKPQGNLFTKLKLNRKLFISYYLQNPRTILCFLLKNKINNDLRIKTRNKILDDKTNINDNEKLLKIKKKYLINKQSEDFYTNKTVFLYNYENNTYIKSKGNLSLKQLTIHGKVDKVIYIQDIKLDTLTYCKGDENPMVSSLYVASGARPPYNFFFKTNNEQVVIGLKNEKKKKKWEKGMKFSIDNYRIFTTDIDYKMIVNNLKNYILGSSKNIIEESLNYENLRKSKKKKRILDSFFEDKKMQKLIEDIFIYKILIENKDYKKGLIQLYEILIMINESHKQNVADKKSRISEVINQEKLLEYIAIYDRANDLMKKNNNEILEKTLKNNIFDDSIVPFLKKSNERFLTFLTRKTDIRKIIQNLISYYFVNFYNYYNNKDSFLYLTECFLKDNNKNNN